MRTSKLKRSTLSLLRITAVISCLSLSAFAQAPSPTPSPAPASPAGSSMPQLFDKLIGRAGALIPMLQNEIEGPLLPWLENLSWWLAVLVIIFGFARLWRENCRRWRRSLLVVRENRHYFRAGGKRPGNRQQTRRDRPGDRLGRKWKQR